MMQGAGYVKDIRKAVRRSKVAAEFFSKPSIAVCTECNKRGMYTVAEPI
jgi:hypothetical protein